MLVLNIYGHKMPASSLLKQAIKSPIKSLAAEFGPFKFKSKSPRLWVVMYHRILPHSDKRFIEEEPGMVVTPESLDLHFALLQKHFTCVSLQDWVTRLQQGLPLPHNACAITFDDGWLDNYEYAFPLIQKHQIPATIYLVSDLVGSNQLFWPNRIAQLLKLPNNQLSQIDWLQNNSSFHGTREHQAHAIYQLKTLSDQRILELLDSTEQALGLQPPLSPSLMNWEQIQQMQRTGLVDFGSHTCQHVRLKSSLDTAFLAREITESKNDLEKHLDRKVNLFCYPNGDYCPEALRIVSENYQAAVTTQSGINHKDTLNLHTLFRFGAHDDATSTKRNFLSRLSGWPLT
mgnify:CR=1 FL=1